jgi:hypothetical protein
MVAVEQGVQQGRDVPDITAGCLRDIGAGTEDTALLLTRKRARARCGASRAGTDLWRCRLASTEGYRFILRSAAPTLGRAIQGNRPDILDIGKDALPLQSSDWR